MIDHRQKYCREDLSKIENYELAKADNFKGWTIHHRLELTLDGEFAHTADDLKRLDMYYNRPYFELIFLTRAEHQRLHRKGMKLSEETKNKLRALNKGEKNHFYGKKHSDETKAKISTAKKGKKLSAETKALLSRQRKDKPLSERNKISKAEAQRLIGLKYREYKANGGTMSYNEFRRSIRKQR